MYVNAVPGSGLGAGITSGTLSAPVKPLITSTKSPGLMIVPTPEIWSTWTAIPTRPAGTSMFSMPPPASGPPCEMYWPAVTFVRAIWPTTNDVSVKLSAGLSRDRRSPWSSRPSTGSWRPRSMSCGRDDDR